MPCSYQRIYQEDAQNRGNLICNGLFEKMFHEGDWLGHFDQIKMRSGSALAAVS